MAFTENYSDFFSDFAVEAIWKGIKLQGILDKEYIETGRVQGFTPVFTCIESELNESQNQGDAIIVDSIAYTIAEYHQDGTGLMRLILEVT